MNARSAAASPPPSLRRAPSAAPPSTRKKWTSRSGGNSRRRERRGSSRSTTADSPTNPRTRTSCTRAAYSSNPSAGLMRRSSPSTGPGPGRRTPANSRSPSCESRPPRRASPSWPRKSGPPPPPSSTTSSGIKRSQSWTTSSPAPARSATNAVGHSRRTRTGARRVGPQSAVPRKRRRRRRPSLHRPSSTLWSTTCSSASSRNPYPRRNSTARRPRCSTG